MYNLFFSHPRENNFKYSFKDISNLIFSCIIKAETKIHYNQRRVTLRKDLPSQKILVPRTPRGPFFFFFFLSGFSFTGTDNSQDSRGRERTFFYSTLLLPPAHEYSDICVQLCTWDDYHRGRYSPTCPRRH